MVYYYGPNETSRRTRCKAPGFGVGTSGISGKRDFEYEVHDAYVLKATVPNAHVRACSCPAVPFQFQQVIATEARRNIKIGR